MRVKKLSTLALAVWALFIPSYSDSKEVLPGPIPAELVEVLDGDSFKVVAHLWPGLYQHTTVRLNGIDTPEMRGKCDLEVSKAHEAQAKLQSLIGNNTVLLYKVMPDKYHDRVEANATVAGRDLSSQMLEAGLARVYNGKKRRGWCE